MSVVAAQPTTATETPARGYRALGVFALYLVAFLALFAQLPLRGRLPGNIDTWYAISLPNLYLAELRSMFGAGNPVAFMVPTEHPLAYGETAAGLALIPMALRLIGFSDLLTSYLFTSISFALTAFATYRFASLYVRSRAAAMLAGGAFAASNFLIATIDSPHTVFFGVAFLSLYHFERWLADDRRRDIWIAAALAGLQTYVAAYGFLILMLGLGALAIARWGQWWKRPRALPRVASAVLIAALLAAPFFGLYAARLTDYFSFRSQAMLFAEFNSLDPEDLFNPLRDNILYPEGPRFTHHDAVALMAQLGTTDPTMTTPDFGHLVGRAPEPDEESLWVGSRRRAFAAILLYILALVALRRRFEGRGGLLALMAVGFAVALGPVITVGDSWIPAPAYPLYAWLPGFHLFRIPSRAFALTLLGLVVAAARGLEDLFASETLERRLGSRPWLIPLAWVTAALLIALENIPVPLRSFAGTPYLAPPEIERTALADDPGALILNLPSGIGYGLAGSADDLNVFNRELIYMNRHAAHGHPIVNGVNGYIPNARIRTQALIAALPAPEAIRALAELGVDAIVHHQDLVLPQEEQLLPRLRASPLLQLVRDAPPTTVFRIVR